MRYVHINWIHDFKAEPIHIYSEVGDDDYEIRKVEVFPDGKLGFASDALTQHGTELGDQPFPVLEEINGKDEWEEMIGQQIDQSTFEAMWQAAIKPD